MENSDKESKYFKAQERVNAIKEFYNGLLSYLFVLVILAGINYYTNEWQYPWVLWVAFGWGIGLVFKAIKVFGMNPFFGNGWEERKIKQFMNEDKESNQWK